MSSDSSDIERFQQIQDEHRELMGLLGKIESALADQAAPIDDIVDLIGKLGHQLTKHFQTEEAGGYFADALVNAPQLVARANTLMMQHPKMTRSARKLSHAVDPEVDPDGWRRQTAERFQDLLAELKAHERDEDRLIQEAYTRDIGSHD